MYIVTKFQPHIHYILGYMITPSQGSSLFHDSSLNKTPGDNCYILGYKGPNEMFEAVPKRAWTVLSVVEVWVPDDETVTRGSPYNFAMLNNPEIGHLGKIIISPNW